MEMAWSEEQKSAFGVALEESTWVGAEVSPRGFAGLTFSVLTLPDGPGPEPEDRRVQIILGGVSRVAARLLGGDWTDPNAKVIPFELDELLGIVTELQSAVYGWDFLDVPAEEDFLKWSHQLSLDWVNGPFDQAHTLDLFQEAHVKHLDMRIWFETIEIFRPTGESIDFDEFCADGKRWWDALHAGDGRTLGHGITAMPPAES
jgi:hypothetical protein